MEGLFVNSKTHIHFGFKLVLALVLTSFGPLSLGLSCAGIFYTAVSSHLGVGTGTLSYYTSILWIASLVTLPALGRLLSRVDSRLCVGGAVILAAADFVWLSLMQHLWQFFVAAAVMGISVTMLLFLAPSTLINRWFAKRAGFYLGIVMAFTGVGGVVWSAAGGVLIQEIGWSATYLVFAVIALATLPTAVLFVSDSPEKKGMLPWGAEACNESALTKGAASAHSRANDENTTSNSASDAAHGCAPNANSAPNAEALAKPSSEQGMGAAAAFHTPTFPLLLIMCFSLNFNMYVYFMIPSYVSMQEIGALMPLLGATASSVAMAGQTISKIALGYIGDRFPYAGAIAGVSLGVIGTALLAVGGASAMVVYLAAFTYGFYYGVTNVMMPILTRRSFGTVDYAKIYARISMAATLAGSTAGFVWGSLIDATGSYLPMFIGVDAMLILTIVLIIALARLDKRQSASA